MDICRRMNTTAYVDYCTHRIRLLLHFNVTPVLVFDGAELPMKADTHAERRARREEALVKADDAFARGDRRKANEFYQRACPVTSEMARHVIRQCRKMNVEYVVAPFEADAQLAWMVSIGQVDSIISEDSDLLVYGIPKVLFKMNREGHGDLFQIKNLPSLSTLSFADFTEDMFMYMCVCSGCDFFKGVTGLGIRKAHPIVRRYQTISRIIHAIRLNPKYRLSKTFTADFVRACLVFRHQTVFDVQNGKTVSLRPLSESVLASLPNGAISRRDDRSFDLSFLGRHLDPLTAQRVAQAHIHPSSLKEYSEPLDIVERPVVASKPPLSLPVPNAPSKSNLNSKTLRQPSFFVAPARSSQHSRGPDTWRSPNLKQRLQSSNSNPRGTVFHPIKEAQQFKSVSRLSLHQSPNGVRNGVWKRFQRSNLPNQSLTCGNKGESQKNTGSSAEGAGAAEHNDKTNEIVGSRDDGGTQTVPESSLEKSADSSYEAPAAKRPRWSPPSTKRVEAVNRAVSKFALTSAEDRLEKFNSREVLLPCPDHDSYKLFDEVDEMSRDGVEGKFTSKRSDCPVGVSSEASSQPMSCGNKKQVLVSRYFTPSQGEASRKLSRASKASRPISHTTLPPRRESGAVTNRLNMGNMRRGAVGKRMFSDERSSA